MHTATAHSQSPYQQAELLEAVNATPNPPQTISHPPPPSSAPSSTKHNTTGNQLKSQQSSQQLSTASLGHPAPTSTAGNPGNSGHSTSYNARFKPASSTPPQHAPVHLNHKPSNAPRPCVQSPAHSPPLSLASVHNSPQYNSLTPSGDSLLYLSLPPAPSAFESAPLSQSAVKSKNLPPARHSERSVFCSTAPARTTAVSSSTTSAALSASREVRYTPLQPRSAGPPQVSQQRPSKSKHKEKHKSNPYLLSPTSETSPTSQKRPTRPSSERSARTYAHAHAYVSTSPHSAQARTPHRVATASPPPRSNSRILPAAQHAKTPKSRGPKHRPAAPSSYVPVSSATAPLLTDGVPAPGAAAASGFIKLESASESDYKQHHVDCEILTGEGSAKHALEHRKVMWGAWALQVIVIGLLIGTVLAVPRHKRYVEERRKVEPTDWVAGNLPGFLAALLCPTLFVLCYLWYVKECYSTSTAEHIQNVDRTVNVQDHMQQLRCCRPSVTFSATCYHFETKVRYERGEKQTYTLTVVTHEATKEFVFSEWQDATPHLNGSDDVNMTNLVLRKELEVSDAARQRYFEEFNDFCKKNHYDVAQDFCRVMEVEGFKESQLYFRDLRKPSWWVSSVVYWLTAVLLLNVPFRMWLNANTCVRRQAVVKQIVA